MVIWISLNSNGYFMLNGKRLDSGMFLTLFVFWIKTVSFKMKTTTLKNLVACHPFYFLLFFTLENGFIEYHELRSILTTKGDDKLDPNEVDEMVNSMISEADLNMDFMIDYCGNNKLPFPLSIYITSCFLVWR